MFIVYFGILSEMAYYSAGLAPVLARCILFIILLYLILLQAIFIIPMSQRQNRIDEYESRDVILHARS